MCNGNAAWLSKVGLDPASPDAAAWKLECGSGMDARVQVEAEKAAWKVAETEHLDLVAINPVRKLSGLRLADNLLLRVKSSLLCMSALTHLYVHMK